MGIKDAVLSKTIGVVVTLGLIILVSSVYYTILLYRQLVTATTTTNESQATLQPKGPVAVMYAASLLKTFEESLGPSFEAKTGYPYQGEARGSVQIANMILDGLRRPDVFVSAGTIPIMKLMNTTDPLTDWLVKFGSAEIVIAYSPKSQFFTDLDKARTGDVP
ncbi:MAG: substrate-binding domain-containing protein, partial [Nitrososphaeraceae archaeon]